MNREGGEIYLLSQKVTQFDDILTQVHYINNAFFILFYSHGNISYHQISRQGAQ